MAYSLADIANNLNSSMKEFMGIFISNYQVFFTLFAYFVFLQAIFSFLSGRIIATVRLILVGAFFLYFSGTAFPDIVVVRQYVLAGLNFLLHPAPIAVG